MKATGGVLSPWFYLYLGLGACLPVASKRHPCGLKANSRDCFTFNTGRPVNSEQYIYKTRKHRAQISEEDGLPR